MEESMSSNVRSAVVLAILQRTAPHLKAQVERNRDKALERNDVYLEERWGSNLRAGEEVTVNISANRTETMLPPTSLSFPPSRRELEAIGLTHYSPVTPINITRFDLELKNHPNRPLIEWALRGLKYGVRTGFTGTRDGYEMSNLKSATTNPEPLRDNIKRELEFGRLIGPLSKAPMGAKVSPVGTVPKRNSEKFRTINHLSLPLRTSVNDGQHEDRLFTEYDQIGVTLNWIRYYGKGCYVTGGDVEDAFRTIPVHPADILLQYMQMDGSYYGDKNLVFGMRSSPIIFNTYAGLMGWVCIKNYGLKCWNNYLDDYINVAIDLETSQKNYLLFQMVYREIGWPLKPAKLVPPTTKFTHLGHHIDTKEMTITYPQDRRDELIKTLNHWIASDTKQLHYWWKLQGWLIWCCYTNPHIRPFIQPLYEKTAGKTHRISKIRITQKIRNAFRTVIYMLKNSNGVHLFQPAKWGPDWTNSHVFVDATPSQIGAWLPELNIHIYEKLAKPLPIAQAEACAALTALTYITKHSSVNSNRLVIYSDNMGVTEAMHAGRAPNSEINDYICMIAQSCFTSKLEVRCFYIPTEENCEADRLSRDDIVGFHSLQPNSKRIRFSPQIPLHTDVSPNEPTKPTSTHTASPGGIPARKPHTNTHPSEIQRRGPKIRRILPSA